jgi:hypothetical protein
MSIVPVWRSWVILIVAGVVGLSYWFNPPMNVQPQAGVVMDLPVIVGDFFGKQGQISDVELRILPKDTQFARRYYDDGRGLFDRPGLDHHRAGEYSNSARFGT